MNGVIDYANDASGKKLPFFPRCEQEMIFFPVFLLATGLKCGFCSRSAQDVDNHFR